VWDGFSIACVAGGVFFMLVFLATRNALGLTVWQEIAQRGSASPAERTSVARPGRGSLIALFVVTLGVLALTVLVSPYLFRTTEKSGEHGKNSDKSAEQKKHAGEGNDTDGHERHGRAKGRHRVKRAAHGSGDGASDAGSESSESAEDESDDPIDPPDMDEAEQAAREALELGLRLFMWLLLAVLGLLALVLVLLPPLRRALLIRHLERPLWPVAPTARVMNLWRRALATLAVIDIEPSAGETPRDFARRVEVVLGTTLGSDARGLAEAAAIVEKIDYAGRGLGATDEQEMRSAVTAFVATVTPHIRFGKKVAAAWMRTPEVES
jgi:hypothetical protein